MSKERVFIFLAFTAIAFIAYRNCFNIFIPADNYGLLLLFERNNFADAMSHVFHTAAPYFIGFPLCYFFYQVFDITPAYWITAGILLHIINACIIYVMAASIIKTFSPGNSKLIALFSALCFLISPYQTENIIWISPNIIRLFNATVMLLAFYVFIRYLSSPSFYKVLFIQFLFLLGLFSYEFTLISPLIFFIFYLLFRLNNKTLISRKSFFIQILFPQILFVGSYLLICKFYTEHWLWHSGNMTDIFQLSFWAKTLLKYFAKFFLFYRYLPLENLDGAIRNISTEIILPTAIILFTFIGFYFRKIIKKKKEEGSLLLALFLCFLISLLPVLPLDSSFLKYIYPDRYGYLPSVFFYLFFVSSVFFLVKKIATPVMIGYVALCWILLMKTIPVWTSVNDYCNRLIENYKPFLKYEKVFVLDAPAYYNGIAAFRSAFSSAIFFKYNSPDEKINFITGSYYDSPSDTLISINRTGNKIEVKGNPQRLHYFSTAGGWAKSYETDEYKVDFDSTGCSYILTFKKEIPQNSAFIYAAGDSWKKVD